MKLGDIQNYVFIDGNYLRRAYEDTMRKFFDDVHHRNLDFEAIRRNVGASKAFYYDAVDEEADDAEARKAYLDELRSLDGFHVRQGTITGKAKKQKRVDVQLAVECLMHAYNKNIWHSTLIAGDLDFEPLVTALINVGTHVHVYYEAKSGARGLYDAADIAVPITLDTFWEWSTAAWRNAHPRPETSRNESSPGQFIYKRRTWMGNKIELQFTNNGNVYILFVPRFNDQQSLSMRYSDKQRLEEYFTLRYGALEWEAEQSETKP